MPSCDSASRTQLPSRACASCCRRNLRMPSRSRRSDGGGYNWDWFRCGDVTSLFHRLREALEHRDRCVPIDAAVSDAAAVDQRLSLYKDPATTEKVALDHHTND